MSIPLTEIERINVLLPTELFAGSKDWRVGSIADRVDWLLTMYASAKEEIERLQSALEVQPLPFGVGGGLVAIKTLLSRDPCAHANTAIQMIDAILAGTAPLAQPQQEPEIVQRVKRYAGQTLRTARNPNITARECIELANWIAAALQPAQGEKK